MNALIIVNYNSNDQVTELLKASKFDFLNISKVFVHCNGDKADNSYLITWYEIAISKNLSLSVVNEKNLGYGEAINHWLNLNLQYKYLFFSNADLWIDENQNFKVPLNADIVGFGLWQNNKLLLSKISFLTPLLPVRFRNLLNIRNKFGNSKAIHGGFFGVKTSFIKKTNIRFNNYYFLYWDELWFCYEAYNKFAASIIVSDMAIINHDGIKSGHLNETRYYLLRNGLDFYINKKSCVLCSVILILINFIYAVTQFIFRKEKPKWFFDSIYDYKKRNFGKAS